MNFGETQTFKPRNFLLAMQRKIDGIFKNWPQQYFWSHMLLQRLLLVTAHHKPEPMSLLLAL